MFWKIKHTSEGFTIITLRNKQVFWNRTNLPFAREAAMSDMQRWTFKKKVQPCCTLLKTWKIHETWNSFETTIETCLKDMINFLESPNNLEIPLKILWNSLATSLKHLWISLKYFWNFLKPPWNFIETHWTLPQTPLASAPEIF